MNELLKTLNGNVEVVESSDGFQALMKELSKHPILCLDTETVGNYSREQYRRAFHLSLTHPLHLAKAQRIERIYEDCYKRKKIIGTRNHPLQYRTDKPVSKAVKEYLDTVKRRCKSLESDIQDCYKRAQKHPGGLHFYENQLGCLQIGVENVCTNGFTSYLIRPSVVDSNALWDLIRTRLLNILHYAQFDYKIFRQHLGILLPAWNLYDTQIVEYVLTAGTYLRTNMAVTAKRRLEIDLSKDKAVRVSDWSGEWGEEQVDYAGLDVIVPYLIRREQLKDLEEAPQSLKDVIALEHRIVPYTAGMEMAGLGLDVAKVTELLQSETQNRSAIVEKLQDLLDLPRDLPEEEVRTCLNSKPQLKESLDKLGLDVSDTKEETLKKLEPRAPEVINCVLEYRKVDKLLTTYLKPFIERGQDVVGGIGTLYGSLKQCFTATGRYSSEDPNLQNLPATREFRSCIVPRASMVFIQGDLSSIEPRILAHITQDPVLLNAFRTGKDPYKLTASLMYEIPYEEVTKQQRKYIKAVMLGLMYGKTEFGLSKDLGIDVLAAIRLIKRFFAIHLPVERWIKQVHKEALENGYVTTLGGRRRIIPGLRSTDPRERQAALREAVNTIIQGTAGDCMKRSICLLGQTLEQELFKDFKLCLTIHDELLLEAPDTELGHSMGKWAMRNALIEGTRELITTVPIKVGGEKLPEWQDVFCTLGCCRNKPFEPLLVYNWGDSKDE